WSCSGTVSGDVGGSDGVTPVDGAIAESSLVFTGVLVGTTSAPSPVTITNASRRSLTLESVSTQPPFAVSGFTQPVVLRARGSFVVHVTFTPTSAGAVSGTLVATFSRGSDRTIPLSGVGIATPTPTPTVVNGACGAANGVATAAAPSAGLCSAGASSA